MASQLVTEEELRRICLDAASRGEGVGYIINDYLYLNFLHEQQEADRAASHRSEDDPGEWWTESGAPRAEGRHRAAG
ncbi:hypothetical protein MWU75_02515 [Ornithinimicrobium sp. F0845]|uniref:hypothetical protein n=1 Tax=Ornithinimicrobium sp. F0845 TaxID=2926412 RepID=UPI001FF5D0CB|nr:hypothetical protein [Ornithinimicrobium sp. F0845]MCK0111014.1 hypothetical protein [Ornithinimicrobium sp. F0845]